MSSPCPVTIEEKCGRDGQLYLFQDYHEYYCDYGDIPSLLAAVTGLIVVIGGLAAICGGGLIVFYVLQSFKSLHCYLFCVLLFSPLLQIYGELTRSLTALLLSNGYASNWKEAGLLRPNPSTNAFLYSDSTSLVSYRSSLYYIHFAEQRWSFCVLLLVIHELVGAWLMDWLMRRSFWRRWTLARRLGFLGRLALRLLLLLLTWLPARLLSDELCDSTRLFISAELRRAMYYYQHNLYSFEFQDNWQEWLATVSMWTGVGMNLAAVSGLAALYFMRKEKRKAAVWGLLTTALFEGSTLLRYLMVFKLSFDVVTGLYVLEVAKGISMLTCLLLLPSLYYWSKDCKPRPLLDSTVESPQEKPLVVRAYQV